MLHGYTRSFSQQLKGVLALSLAITLSVGLQAQNQLFKEDFENGLGNEWTVNNLFAIVNSESWKGNASGGSLSGSNNNTISADYKPKAIKGGSKLDSVVFYWYETVDNNGFRFQFVDDAGDVILGVASDNPQWEISTDSATQGINSCFEFFDPGFGQEYEDWTKVKVEFNWQKGKYTYTYEDQDDGASASGTRTLVKSTNVAEFRIRDGDGGCIGPADHVIFDDIAGYGEFRKPPKASFSAPDTVYPGQSICIKSTSLKATGFEWFVNGNSQSKQSQLDYKVGNQLGKQTIKLEVSNSVGNDDISKDIVVAQRKLPNSDFIADNNIVDVLDVVQFKDLTSGGPSSWKWTFPNAPIGGIFFPSATGSGSGITLEVKAHGDFGFSGENYDVIDENGNVLASGITGSGGDCQSNFNANTTINLSFSQLRNYLQDGTFQITLDANNNVDDICDKNDGFQNDDVTIEGKFILTYPTGQGCLSVTSNTSSLKGCGGYNRSQANEDGCEFDLSVSGLPQPSNSVPVNNDTTQNPNVQFIIPGKYDVCLATSNKVGADTVCKKDYIIVREDYKVCQDDEAKSNYGLLLDDAGRGSNYQPGRNCSFTINPCAKNLMVNFKTFELGQGDFVKIYDGTDTSGKPLWNVNKYGKKGITGNLSEKEQSKFRKSQTGSVHVVFTSDNSGEAEGFALGWQSDSATFQKPVAGFIAPDTLCPGDQFMVKDTSDGKNLSYTWGFNNDTTLTGSATKSYVFENSGSKFVELIIEGCGGKDTVLQNIFLRNVNMPPTGNFTANDTTTITGGILSFTTTAMNCANFFEWDFVGSPVQYVQGTGPGSQNPKVRFLTEGLVDVKLRIGNEQDTIVVNKSNYINVKCTPTVNQLSSDIGISRVQLGKLDNRSPIGESQYTNYFQSRSAVAELEEPQVITISRNTTANAQNVKLWIDLNGDSDFDESNELVAKWDSSKARTFVDTFTIRKTKYLGDRRMRIGVNISDLQNTPCGTNDVGEFEDYKLKVRRDQTPPTFQLKGPDTLTLRACNPVSTLDTGAIAFDNLQGRLGPANVSLTIDTTRAGFYPVTYSATDTSGNTGTRTQYIQVLRDTTSPNLTLNGQDSVLVSVFNNFTDPGVMNAVDGCSGIDTVVTMNKVNTDKLGQYKVTYRAIDEAGNVNMKFRVVKVADTTMPSVILDGNSPASVSLDGVYTDAGIKSISDNFYDSADLTVRKMGKVNPSLVDTFTITYEVVDPSGNKTVVKRDVFVEDREAPTVTTDVLVGDTLAGDVTLPIGESLNVEGRTRISDNAGSDQITLRKKGNFFNKLNASGEATELGTFNARYVYQDQSGNTTTINLDVTVIDQEKPEIVLKPGNSINLPRFQTTGYAKAFDTGATVNDNHKVAKTYVDTSSSYFTEYAVSDSFGFSRGIYEITYVAEDSAGNVSTKDLIVNVKPSATGIAEDGQTFRTIKAYPNPTDGQVRISIQSNLQHPTDIVLMNNTGQQVRMIREGLLEEQTVQVNLDDLPKGIYYLRMTNREQNRIQKIVLQ